MTDGCEVPIEVLEYTIPPNLEIKYFEDRSYLAYDILYKRANLIEKYKPEYFELNEEELISKLNTVETLSSSLHANILNLLTSQLIKSTLPPIEELLNYTKITNRPAVANVFGIRRLISDSSTYGLVMQAGRKDYSYVIKTPKDIVLGDLSHEAIIALYAINNLRHFIPNFAYCYSFGNCSPPIIGLNKMVNAFCNKESISTFLVLENVSNIVSWEKFVIISTLGEFSNAILQIFNALNLGYKKYSYVHHDLSPRNILIREFEKEVDVNIYLNDDIIRRLSSNYVPYIIDYGFNKIKIGNKFILPENLPTTTPDDWVYDFSWFILNLYTIIKGKSFDRENKLRLLELLWYAVWGKNYALPDLYKYRAFKVEEDWMYFYSLTQRITRGNTETPIWKVIPNEKVKKQFPSYEGLEKNNFEKFDEIVPSRGYFDHLPSIIDLNARKDRFLPSNNNETKINDYLKTSSIPLLYEGLEDYSLNYDLFIAMLLKFNLESSRETTSKIYDNCDVEKEFLTSELILETVSDVYLYFKNSKLDEVKIKKLLSNWDYDENDYNNIISTSRSFNNYMEKLPSDFNRIYSDMGILRNLITLCSNYIRQSSFILKFASDTLSSKLHPTEIKDLYDELRQLFKIVLTYMKAHTEKDERIDNMVSNLTN